MAQNKKENLKKIVNLREFEEAAKQNLTHSAYTYYRSGANDEISLNENLNSWKNIYLKQRVLQDLEDLNTETTVLGRKIAFPLGIAPTAMHKLADPEGEAATAKACKAKNVAFCLSTLSNCNQEEVAEAQGPDGFRWFQLYAVKDRQATLKIIKKAEKAGYQAIVLTVDVPVFGKRDGDEKNKFRLPDNLQLKILEEQNSQYGSMRNQHDQGSNLVRLSQNFDNSNWSTIYWIKEATKLPIILKGILCVEDAEMAVKLGFEGIWVSNHGARQLDGAIPPIEALQDIVSVCKGKCEIYVDGGARRGSDIFKAVALGANCVFVGRPSVFSLAAGGQKGVEHMIQIMHDEFKKTMQLCGTKSVEMISTDYLVSRKPAFIPKL